MKTNNIRARLTIYGLPDLSKKDLKEFRKWIARVSKELQTEKDMKIYAKNCRFTLYK